MDRETARSSIIVAIDTDRINKARGLVKVLKGKVGGFKFGFEFIYSTFVSLVTETEEDAYDLLDDLRDLFADLNHTEFIDGKIGDIGNTVKGASAAITRLNPLMFNVHAFAGRPALRGAREGIDNMAAELDLMRKPLLLAVTLLTSLDEEDLFDLGLRPEVRRNPPEEEHEKHRPGLVVRYAMVAQEEGCDGVVASAKEAAAIRVACGPDFLIVTPGIRMPGSDKQDQKAVTTPAMALASGANKLVIGRDITGADDPAAAVERIIDHIVAESQAVATA